eukprot:Anaeramoba_ignava/a613424_8.p1 GENE.a613424_8~~a613424_8.p1  ORF type:complete len:298 (+),score=40.76 a613424_8:186-1079(+)
MNSTIMKRYKLYVHLFTAFLAALIFNSCNNAERIQKIEELEAENIQLKKERADNMQALYNFTETLNLIQSNLDTIKQKERIISTIANNDIEHQSDAKDKITQDIESIYNKLIDNRRAMAKMQHQLGKETEKNKSLKQIIDRMNKQMDEKILEIEHLRSQLETMQGEITGLKGLIDTLRGLSAQQKQIIELQQEELETVFYAYGTKKELKENGVVEKGKVLGLGGGKNIDNNLNKEYFTSANKFKLRSINLKAKKVKLITPHPTDSYKLMGEKPIDSLVITDPVKFWSNSQYLVIEIK